MKRTLLPIAVIMMAVASMIAYNAVDYMPLEIGNYWVYDDSSMTRVAGTIEWSGKTCFVIENFYTDEEEPDSSLMYFEGGALKMVQFDPEVDMGLDFTFLPASFNLSDTWTMLDTFLIIPEGDYEYHVTYFMTGRLDAVEDVPTPAGNYSNCLKVSNGGYVNLVVYIGGMPVYSDSMNIDGGAMWLARNIGVVKTYYIDAETSEEEISLLVRSNTANISESKLPRNLAISAFPNPFNAAVTIEVPVASAEVEILDVMGRLVEKVTASFGQARWNPSSDVAGGVYFARVKAGDTTLTRRIVLIK